MAGAPVCFVSVNETINQPPGARLPAIPQANDLQSALAAIQAMTQILNQLTGAAGAGGANTGAGSPGKQQGSQSNQKDASQSKNQQKQGRWNKINEVKEPVTMTSTDGSVTFTFDQVTSVTMQDTVTGQLLVITT